MITNNRAPPDIGKTWHWLASRGLIDHRASIDYVNYLVASRQFDAATSLRQRFAGATRADYPNPNLVFNGDFEADPSGLVLDWQIARCEGVQATLAAGESHLAARALRLDFDAQQNIEFNHVHQDVVIRPGRYVFEFYVKSDRITTDQGAGFHIFDAEVPSRLDVFIPPALGTAEWARQTTNVRVAATTRLLRVELRRQPSRKFDNKIKGTLWIDSVKLYPAG